MVYNVTKYTVERKENARSIYKATKWEATEISITPVQADVNSRVRSEETTNEVEIIEETPAPEPTPETEETPEDTNEVEKEIINLNN